MHDISLCCLLTRKHVFNRFFVEGATRFDVKQGELGDCWLLAAIANLTMRPKIFKVVVPDDQGFQQDYTGLFHFRQVYLLVFLSSEEGEKVGVESNYIAETRNVRYRAQSPSYAPTELFVVLARFSLA